MVLRGCDSFDLFTSAQYQGGSARWTLTPTPSRVSIQGARNGNGLRSSSIQNIGWCYAYRDFDNQDTWIIGFAHYLVSQAGGDGRICAVLDGATEQVGLWLRTSDFKLDLRRGGVSIATAPTAITAGQWNYIEMKVVIADSGGTAELRVNQVVVATFTGDTKATANAYANRVVLGPGAAPTGGGASVFYDHMFDDLYINDGTGSLNNGYSGDVLVKALYPTAEGTYSDFTPSTGTNNAALVDEAQANDDTDYVSSNTVGHKDTYTYQALPSNTNSVKGVVIVQRMRKDDAGGRTMKQLVRSGGTDYESAAVPITQSYVTYETIHQTDPDTSAQWLKADVDAAEFGVKVES